MSMDQETMVNDQVPPQASPDLPTRAVYRKKIVATPEEIELAKSTLVSLGYPDELYKVTIEGDEFIFRPLLGRDWAELRAFIEANIANLDNDLYLEKICERGLVFPDISSDPMQWDLQRAGCQSTIAKQILAHSGFLDPDIDQSEYIKIEPINSI